MQQATRARKDTTMIDMSLYDLARIEMRNREREAEKYARARFAVKLLSQEKGDAVRILATSGRDGSRIFRFRLRRAAPAA